MRVIRSLLRVEWRELVVAVSLSMVLLPFFDSSMASAQSITVRVVDSATDIPIVGAIVAIIGRRDSAIISRFTTEAGTVGFPWLGQSSTRVFVRKIGYSPATARIPGAMKDTAFLVVRLNRVQHVLNAIEVNADQACGDMTAGGAEMRGLWESIRTALEANRITETEGLARMEIERYERDLDGQLVPVSPARQQRREVATRQPFAAALPDILETQGYVTGDGDAVTYFAPDARTLLSDEFARAHCYSTRRSEGADSDLIGIAFEPKPDISTANVAGVLWLDRRTSALTSLTFSYVNVPSSIPITSAGGRLDFEQLPDGRWIIHHWFIQTPRMGRFTQILQPSFHRVVVDTLIGFREIGAVARLLAPGETVALAADSAASAVSDSSLATIAPVSDSGVVNCSAVATKVRGLTIFGSITDSLGDAIPRSQLVLEWKSVDIRTTGRLVTTGQMGQVIDVEPSSAGNYQVCGLPTGVDYRIALLVDGRRREVRSVHADKSAIRLEVNFVDMRHTSSAEATG